MFVWLGTPCNTWSRARRGGGNGPAPIRDSNHLWGLPNLSEKDQSKIEVGNALLKFSAAVFRLCVSLKIPVVLGKSIDVHAVENSPGPTPPLS